jgi:hypothetical protein
MADTFCRAVWIVRLRRQHASENPYTRTFWRSSPTPLPQPKTGLASFQPSPMLATASPLPREEERTRRIVGAEKMTK